MKYNVTRRLFLPHHVAARRHGVILAGIASELSVKLARVHVNVFSTLPAGVPKNARQFRPELSSSGHPPASVPRVQGPGALEQGPSRRTVVSNTTPRVPSSACMFCSCSHDYCFLLPVPRDCRLWAAIPTAPVLPEQDRRRSRFRTSGLWRSGIHPPTGHKPRAAFRAMSCAPLQTSRSSVQKAGRSVASSHYPHVLSSLDSISSNLSGLLATSNFTSVPSALKCSRPQVVFACSVGRRAPGNDVPLDSTTK